jgi:hypothetical protein
MMRQGRTWLSKWRNGIDLGTFLAAPLKLQPSKPFVMNLEHKTQSGDVKLSSFVVPPRCPGSPVDSSDSSTDYSSLDDYSSQDDDSCSDDTEYSSSSDDYSEESSEESSSEDDDEASKPLYKTLIGNHAIISSLHPSEVAAICSAAVEEDESESEYMSE